MNTQTTSPDKLVPVTGPAEPYVGHAADVAKAEQRAKEISRAAAAPLPGPLREAFAGEPVKLHGLTLQPVNAWLIAILTRIKSPLLDIVEIYRRHGAAFASASPEQRPEIEARIASEIGALKSPPESIIETVFAFVTEVEKLQEILDAGKFTRTALREIGKRFHPAQLGQIEQAIGQHFAASFATALELENKPTNDGSVFTPPPADPRTDSAGGSK